MNEIKKTLAVLKARWPEVAVIIALSLLVPIIRKLLLTGKVLSLSRQQLQFVISIVTLLAAIASALLCYGFLRTYYVENRKRQSVLVLLQTGKYFFWRMFVFYCLYGIPFLIFFLLWSTLIMGHVSPQIGQWIDVLCFTGLKVILIKFILLIPALIIVFDCKVFESFKMLRQCKLSNAHVLIALFFVEITFGLLWMFVPRLGITAASSLFVLMLIQYGIGKFIWLIIWVSAVRFVGSLDLVYDDRETYLGSEI